LCEVSTVLSTSEVGLLIRLCREIGLDYGEVDVLRDVDDGKMYIIDINNTPFGPPNHLDSRSSSVALERLSEAFSASFGSKS
jgi:glutathione synthase/RimK-type ligase-like ATP-grasp enzyme